MLNQLLPSNCSPGSKEREVEKKKGSGKEWEESKRGAGDGGGRGSGVIHCLCLFCENERQLHEEVSEEREGQTERGREITQHIQMEQKAKGSKCCQRIPYSTDSLEQAQSCTTTCPIYQLECQQILHLRSSPKSALPHDSTITLSAYTYSTLLSLTRQIPLHCQTIKKTYWANNLHKMMKSCVNYNLFWLG